MNMFPKQEFPLFFCVFTRMKMIEILYCGQISRQSSSSGFDNEWT